VSHLADAPADGVMTGGQTFHSQRSLNGDGGDDGGGGADDGDNAVGDGGNAGDDAKPPPASLSASRRAPQQLRLGLRKELRVGSRAERVSGDASSKSLRVLSPTNMLLHRTQYIPRTD